MPPPKTLNLSRFKKSTQGLIEFATLLEQAESTHRQRILKQTELQDPDLHHDVSRKIIYFDELIYLEDGVLAEILAKTPPKVLAFALKASTPEMKQKMLSHLGHRESRAVLDEDEKAKEVSTPFVEGAQRQILKIARTLEAKNLITYEVGDCPRFHTAKKVNKA